MTYNRCIRSIDVFVQMVKLCKIPFFLQIDHHPNILLDSIVYFFRRCILDQQEEAETPSETDTVKSQISSKISRGKKAQKDAIKDITNDSQVNSYFPYRWSFTYLSHFCTNGYGNKGNIASYS